MYLKEFENIEIKLTHYSQPTKWEKTLGFKPELNRPYNIHWSILSTKNEFRLKKIKIMCDDCGLVFEKRIRYLDKHNNTHFCPKCSKKGNKNGMYGKQGSENQKRSLKKWMNEKGNPFTWDSVKQKIKNNDKERVEKIIKKTRGQKRSNEVKQKMSLSMREAIRTGRLKTWNNVKVKQYKNIDYQGTYELEFLKFMEKHGKLDKIIRGPSIQYKMDELYHDYYIDYMIKNTDIVFEIKSIYYWKKREDVNILKKQEAEKHFKYFLVLDNNFTEIEQMMSSF